MILLTNISDAKMLTEISLKSKAIWGSSDEQLKNWTEELTVTEEMIPEMIQEMVVCKFILDVKIVGFYILNQPQEQSIALEFLFVHPIFIAKGIGNQLIQHPFENAKQLNCKPVILLSDPNAVPFY
jgi:N-acetylglutamate synthase-like GNAT family acetyltransferase